MDKTDMIYGTRAVIEAIKAGRQIERILIQKDISNELARELMGLARKQGISFTYVPQEKLNRLSGKNHQGVICILSSIQYAQIDDIIHASYSQGKEPFLLVLDRITDVRNFGAIVRTAECAGISAIVIGDRGNAPITSDAMKTSAGALNYLPICREKDLKKTITFLHENGIMVVACTEKGQKTIYELEFNRPVALIMGSEEDGISDSLLTQADELAKIPLNGQIDSLNVSVAAGIAMYEVVRQKLSEKL